MSDFIRKKIEQFILFVKKKKNHDSKENLYSLRHCFFFYAYKMTRARNSRFLIREKPNYNFDKSNYVFDTKVNKGVNAIPLVSKFLITSNANASL